MSFDLTDRQLEIIEASGKILMEKGVLGLTTKNLSKEMNFSESALYRHFKDKEAIISLLIGYLAKNINTRFDAIVNSDLAIEEKFIELFKSQFSFFKNNPHFIVIVLSDGLIDNSEEVKIKICDLMKTNFVVFKKIINQGQEVGSFSKEVDSDYLVHFAMGSFRLQMLKWKLANFSFDIEIEGMKTMNNLTTLFRNNSSENKNVK